MDSITWHLGVETKLNHAKLNLNVGFYLFALYELHFYDFSIQYGLILNFETYFLTFTNIHGDHKVTLPIFLSVAPSNQRNEIGHIVR